MSEGWQYLLPTDYCKTEAVISRLQPSPRSKFATHKNNGGEDMTTIYKAIPNQSEVTISCLDESLRFIGNDVKKLTIDNVQYGRSIILEEIDSLEEITVRKPGAIFAFNSFPTKTIRISGSFEEVRVKDESNHYCIHRFGSDPTLPMETLWGAIISQDTKVKCGKLDALILKSTGDNQLDITDELSHIEGIDENNEIKKIRIYPQKSKSLNLAFDVTPAKLVTGLITEKGVCEASEKGLKGLFK